MIIMSHFFTKSTPKENEVDKINIIKWTDFFEWINFYYKYVVLYKICVTFVFHLQEFQCLDGSWIILDTVEILGYSVVLLKLRKKLFVTLRLNLLGMCLMQIIG